VSALSPSPGESLELYGAPTGNCRRAAIALSEAGLAYAVRTVGLAGGEHRGEAFLALNPAGKVPVLVAGTARGAAARAPGRLPPAEGDGTRVRVLEAFFHFVTDVIGVNGAAFTLQRLGLPDAAAVLTERYLAAIAGSERFLGESGFMGGDACSIADIAGFTIVSAVADRLEWDRLPRLSAWRERIGRRPAVQAGMAAFDMLAATP
jgi:GST-like protein